ncbi:MAG: cytochrome b/b6 domain-containing protein [Pseudomonadota bacterium]
MPLQNTASSFGSLAKLFHWMIAVLVIALIPLGIVANGLPAETSEEIAQKATLFSIHKTFGVLVFLLALARIVWAIIQPRPVHLHPHRTAETLAASIAHWLLYGALVLVPLSGWLHHSATEGFAPIWWPFGQSLPFVPKDAELAELFAGLHIVFERVLAITVLLHIAGALKHHFIDRDDTLRRMLPGMTEAAPETDAEPPKAWIAPSAAVAVFAGAIVLGGVLGVYHKGEAIAAQAPLEEVVSDWTVETGEITITIRQLGSDVTGSFADWTAAIAFSETPVDGSHGTVEVTIAIPSLTLGSVTGQAMGADFFDAENHPTATFTADLLSGEAEGQYRAVGSLDIRGASVPQDIPFELTLEGDTATATLSTNVDRRDFSIGMGQSDEGSLGFSVGIAATVTATRTSN